MFKDLFKPAIKVLNKLKLPQKFGMMNIFLIFMIMLTMYLLISKNNEDIKFTGSERAGVEYNNALKSLIKDVQQHRGMISAYLNGDNSFKEKIISKEADIKNEIEAVSEIDVELDKVIGTTQKWNGLKEEWLGFGTNTVNLTPKESFEKHTQYIEKLIDMMVYVNNSSNLTLDPALDTYYLMDVSMFKLPNETEKMGQARAIGSGIAAKGSITPNEKAQLIALAVHIDTIEKAVESGLNEAFIKNSKIKENIDIDFRESSTATVEFYNLLDSQIINTETITVKSNTYFDSATKSIDSAYKLYDTVSLQLDNLLKDRMEGSELERLLVIIFGVLAILLIIYMHFAFSQSVLGAVDQLKDVTAGLANGDLTKFAKVDSKDEIGELAESINKVIEGQTVLIKAVVNSTQMVASASEQLSASTEEMSGNAQTSRQNTKEVALSVSNLGLSIDELEGSSKEMNENVTYVSKSIAEMNRAVNDIVGSVQSAVNAISEVSVSSEQMRRSVETSAQDSESASNTAQSMVQLAEHGKKDVDITVFEMDKIGETVKRLTAKMKTLGESATQISEILDVITDISEQTNLLALNAAIEAARAGEHGKGFAVVAGAIRELSERSHQSTSDISKLIGTIEKEIKDAVAETNEGSKAITYGVSLTKNTGIAFDSIFKAILDTSELIKNISKSTQIQAAKSESIVSSVSNLDAIIQSISAATQEQSASVSEITEASGRMENITQTVVSAIGEQSVESSKMVREVETMNQSISEISSASEEVASGATNLANQADVLLKLIEKYKFKN